MCLDRLTTFKKKKKIDRFTAPPKKISYADKFEYHDTVFAYMTCVVDMTGGCSHGSVCRYPNMISQTQILDANIMSKLDLKIRKVEHLYSNRHLIVILQF